MDDIDELLTEISDLVFMPAKNERIARLYEEATEEYNVFKPSEMLFHVHEREGHIEVYMTPKVIFDLEGFLFDGHAYVQELEEIGLAYDVESVCGILEDFDYTVETLRAKLLEKGFLEMSEEDYDSLREMEED